MNSTQNSAFAPEAKAGFEYSDVGNGATSDTANAAASLPSAKSYQLVKSDTGNNLYVEVKNVYDPLEHHRPRDKASSKGQGLGFMFCCFGGQPPKGENERFGYEVPPDSQSSIQVVKANS